MLGPRRRMVAAAGSGESWSDLPIAHVMTRVHTDGMTPRKPMVRMTVRVPAKLRDAAMAKADENGEYVSEVIRRALESYVTSESIKEEES